MIYFFGALLVGVAGFLALRFRRRVSAGEPAPPSKVAEFFEGVTSAVAKVFKGKYDKQIAAAAAEFSISPVILKAIVAKESSFNPDAINPEKSFTLDGVTYSASDKTGRAKLRAFILSGGNPVTVLRVNPSIGLAQVRLGIARKILRDPGLGAAELFDPSTNLRASAALLRELISAGITLETIDAYNVGQDLQPRNLPYRDAVRKFAGQFEGDF